MATKIIHLEDELQSGEPTIQLVRPGFGYLDQPGVKTASEALHFIKDVRPIPNKTIILVLAMTAGDFYGPNRNGDAWPERPLQAGPTKIGPESVLPKHYKTFETDAKYYRHHINKDPAKSIGDVMKAFYNWTAHRVELLLMLDNNKAGDIVKGIESGKTPAVSMGCRVPFDICLSAGAKVETATGLCPIEEIQIGALVRTHTGKLQSVKDCLSRKYTGTLYTVEVYGVPHSFEVTANHEFYAVYNDVLRKCWGSVNGIKRRCTPNSDRSHCKMCSAEVPSPEWAAIKDLDVGDYLAYPFPQTETGVEEPTLEFSYLAGAYLGNGSLIRQRAGRKRQGPHQTQGLQFSYGFAWKNVARRVEKYLETCTDNKVSVDQHPEKNEIVVRIGDVRLSRKMEALFGHLARGKRIPPQVFSWSQEKRWALLGGYLDADGAVDPKKGSGRLTSINEDLIFSARTLFASLGHPTAYHEESPFSTYTQKYVTVQILSLSATVVGQLKKYSIKARKNHIPRRETNTALLLKNVMLVPITQMSERSVKDHAVYNLAIEEDESYVVHGVTAHNCSRCGNKAPTRRQYCRHARDHLGEIRPNGHNFVWNPDPLFFDISDVFRPAERLGWMMRKVAGIGAAERVSSAFLGEAFEHDSARAANLRKLAIIHQMVRGAPDSGLDPEANVVLTPSFIHDIAERAASASAPIADDMIRNVLAFRPAELFATLSKMGIVLTTPEFIKYFVWKVAPQVKVPDDLLRRAVALQGLAFEFLAENPSVLDAIVETGMFDEVGTNPDVEAVIRPILEKRSQLGDYLYRNLIPEVFKPSTGKGLMDPLTTRDPRTGRMYQTTRSAANTAADWSAEHQLADLAGGGLLGAAAYKLFKMPKLRFLAPIAGLGAAGLGYRGIAGYPSTRAQTGEQIALPRERMPWELRHGLTGRGGTEMVEKRSSVHDGIAAIVALQDISQAGGAVVLQQLTKEASWMNFDEAARWFGEQLIRS